MNTTELLVTAVLLVILAEVTYLVAKLPRQVGVRKSGRQIFVDTSVLIDGRILAVANSGFITDTLVIPRSVIGELQFLADNADHDKRTRARYGLDVVKELQGMTQITVEILQDGSKAEEGVDERLLKLAKQYSGAICTIDYNLNKVAQVEKIAVLNVNELAQSLRMAYLPGEKMLLELVQKGQDSHQAVGYLVDGTMVVVEHASKSIGQKVEIEFIRSLQTAAGKMMFAKPTASETSPTIEPKTPRSQKLLHKQKKQQVLMNIPAASIPPVAEVVPVVATAYHSDKSEANKVQARQPKQQNQSRRQQTVKPQRAAGSQTKNSHKTSAQREASLIELLDKQ